jgi:hypothetical protein
MSFNFAAIDYRAPEAPNILPCWKIMIIHGEKRSAKEFNYFLVPPGKYSLE